jgi:NADH dehydrogenase [ubiquinone] 1 alpha subcomplex assembly factor 7
VSAEPRDLGSLIDMQIRTAGPMSVAAYMGLCLSHPRAGYYQQGRPIGAKGDFITAPEISQMFGEMVGFCLVNLWQQMNEPKSFTLLELGPGRGTLMADILRVAKRAPDFLNALHLQLFESSPVLREEQKNRLGEHNPYWQQRLDEVGEDPLLVVANEFFDALPIRQYVKDRDGWHEREVGLIKGKRAFGLSPMPMPETAIPPELRDAPPGSVFEAGLAAQEAMLQLSLLIARQGGAILAIDYGYGKTQVGETLQAVRNHAYADPLAAPGETDLSAHVDFASLAKVAVTCGLAVSRLATQGDFLRRLGIADRAESLGNANPHLATDITLAFERLTGPDQMGELFKAFCATSPGLTPLGFAS